MDDSPSNAVLLAKLEAMSDTVAANQVVNHDAHVALITQTTKTNGRVSALEQWKNIAVGVIIMINVIFVPIAVSVIVGLLNKYFK